MEDIAEKINSILSDPESLKQLGELARELGFPPPPEEDKTAPGPAPQSPDMPDVGALMALASKLRDMGSDDKNINFLIALRPLLSDEKKPRVDRAIKILRIINVLPALRESGLLGGELLGGL